MEAVQRERERERGGKLFGGRVMQGEKRNLLRCKYYKQLGGLI